jgi:hypothetical protein
VGEPIGPILQMYVGVKLYRLRRIIRPSWTHPPLNTPTLAITYRSVSKDASVLGGGADAASLLSPLIAQLLQSSVPPLDRKQRLIVSDAAGLLDKTNVCVTAQPTIAPAAIVFSIAVPSRLSSRAAAIWLFDRLGQKITSYRPEVLTLSS